MENCMGIFGDCQFHKIKSEQDLRRVETHSSDMKLHVLSYEKITSVSFSLYELN